MNKCVVVFSMAMVIVGGSSPVAAHLGPSELKVTPQTSRMAEGARAMAPIPHIVFCKSNASECRKGASTGWVPMNASRWKDLKTVNARFNRYIEPISDQSNSGKIDVWTIGEKRGDCEEYAIAKRSELIARGWSPSSVLLAVVLDTRGGGHAVAVVRTDQGDFVLDNLTSNIRTWDKTGYTWIKQQSSKNPRVWVRIAEATQPVAPKPKLSINVVVLDQPALDASDTGLREPAL
ncbi:hypothetical protein MNBD_ALPHA09-435 [hydrothermal vent metagenome]|uniref:COGs COG3672 n=1 Tax=hydrothermal vent metagenome TaxID=652676 RepID=A0A3B0T4A0_9ZZZZ